jgi:hypothetical protein
MFVWMLTDIAFPAGIVNSTCGTTTIVYSPNGKRQDNCHVLTRTRIPPLNILEHLVPCALRVSSSYSTIVHWIKQCATNANRTRQASRSESFVDMNIVVRIGSTIEEMPSIQYVHSPSLSNMPAQQYVTITCRKLCCKQCTTHFPHHFSCAKAWISHDSNQLRTFGARPTHQLSLFLHRWRVIVLLFHRTQP